MSGSTWVAPSYPLLAGISDGEAGFMFTAFALILSLSWVLVFRVWFRGFDASRGLGPVGSGSAGLNAFLLPATAGFTLMILVPSFDVLAGAWVAIPDELDDHAGWLALIGGCLIGLGLWMWGMLWPTFLVPPQFRDQPRLITRARRRGRNS